MFIKYLLATSPKMVHNTLGSWRPGWKPWAIGKHRQTREFLR